MSFHPIALFVAIPIVILTAAFVYMIRASSLEREKEKQLAGLPLTKVQRTRVIGYWISTFVLATVYIMAGLPKVTEVNEAVSNFANWGYSENFLLFIGATELIAGIFLIIPRTSLYAASYLAVIMGGAIYTHLAFDPLAYALIPIFCLAFLSFIIFEDWQRQPGTSGEPVTALTH